MEALDIRKQLSVEDYFALETKSSERWEYVNGEAFMMKGTPEHNLVKRNVLAGLMMAVGGGRCVAYPDGQKLSTVKTGAYHYPDVSLYCGPPSRDERDVNAFTNPTLLVEVLSPTTADYDRGGKFEHFRTLESLSEYLVVDIEARLVERRRRLDGGDWLTSFFTEGEVELSSLGVTLELEPLWGDLDSLEPAVP